MAERRPKASPPPRGWPRLMDERTAREYLSFTAREFRQRIAIGHLPEGRPRLTGGLQWHRDDLDKASDAMFEMATEEQHAERKAQVREAIAAHKARVSGTNNQQRR